MQRYVLHNMRTKERWSYAESDFRTAFKRFVLWQRARIECALWYGNEAQGHWTRLYATDTYPYVSRPWR